jgi:hypothetical protein
MGDSPPILDTGTAGIEQRKAHTSVVYFHGMGSQRRYEEVSRLVDCLDKYSFQDEDKTGVIREIHAGLEPCRQRDKKDVSFIRCVRVRNRRDANVRFYEAYWAPLTAGGVPSLQVLRWLLKQVPHPLRALRTPWRLRARLRRASLHGLWSVLQQNQQTNYEFDDLRRMLKLYDNFEGPRAWRDFSEGGFDDFIRFVEREEQDPTKRERLAQLARKWRQHYFLGEISHELVLITIALTALLTSGAVAWAVVAVMKVLAVAGGSTFLRHAGPLGLLEPTFRNVSVVLVALASIVGLNRFFRDYLGDVQLWTTYEETDEKHEKRDGILSLSQDLLRHVLLDENCDRVVIVAHSLGTAVALDTLLALGRHNRARPIGGLPLDKIQHFITMGSPIDKVHYFFESYQGKYHRYNRVVEQIRGDIGSIPFAKNRTPHIHWINFWDRADLVSGSLETPVSRGLAHLRVDNVEIASLSFPAPTRSHSAYFENPTVLRTIFDVIFEGKYSFVTANVSEGKGRDYESLMVGPGRGLASTRLFQAFMLLIPWVGLAGLIFAAGGARLLAKQCQDTVLLLAAILAAGWLLLGRRKNHQALEIPKPTPEAKNAATPTTD